MSTFSTACKELTFFLFEDERKGQESIEKRVWNLQLMFRSIYGEFIATLMYFIPIFGAAVNGYTSDWDSSTTGSIVCLISGLQLIVIIMCFSNISGAVCNPAVSVTLLLTGKLSIRRCILYIIVQITASIVAMGIIASFYSSSHVELFLAATVSPREGSSWVSIFCTEFFCTFFLVYVAFTIAFEEQEMSKIRNTTRLCDPTGFILYSVSPKSTFAFAPFAVGLTVTCLCFIGGSSFVSMNPSRMIGPAVVTGKWDFFYLYVIAEVFGSAAAGFSVIYVQNGIFRGDNPFQEEACSGEDGNCARMEIGTCVSNSVQNSFTNVQYRSLKQNMEIGESS